ncbi:unnamed protein product [marine sediment metagenome]|uniref:Uncharacterized protein n=1 Tax=marine sediment metagenome TaxID=412755 RepID=X1QMQ4_9ZZZZ
MIKWKRIPLMLVSLLLLVVILSGCGVSEEEYNKVKGDLGITQTQLSQTRSELAQKNAEIQQLDGELTSLKNQYDDLQNDYNELESRYDKLEAELTSLFNMCVPVFDALLNTSQSHTKTRRVKRSS